MSSGHQRQSQSTPCSEQPDNSVPPTSIPPRDQHETPPPNVSDSPLGPNKDHVSENIDEDNEQLDRSGSPPCDSANLITEVSSITDTVDEDGLTTEIESVITDSSTNWHCDLKWDAAHETTTFLFRQPGGDQSFAIRERNGLYYVHHCDDGDPNLQSSEKTKEYQTFTEAISSILGALEWGTLPPREPEIWKYEGYEGNGSFGEYLSGDDNESCGSHRFENEDASYTIRIESHAADAQSESEEGQGKKTDADPGSKSQTTVADLSVLTWEEPGAERCRYRRTFSGQRGAFNHLFDLVGNELSHTIAINDQ